MRLRFLLVLAALAAMLPVGQARAEHCSTPIYLFSYKSAPVDNPNDPGNRLGNVTLVSSFIGCSVIGPDPTNPSEDGANTDYIYPGSDTLVVRWLGGAVPVSGTLSFAGQTYALTFTSKQNYVGPAPIGAVIDSQQVFIDPTATVNGGNASITVCPSTDPAECQSRTYRTIA